MGGGTLPEEGGLIFLRGGGAGGERGGVTSQGVMMMPELAMGRRRRGDAEGGFIDYQTALRRHYKGVGEDI